METKDFTDNMGLTSVEVGSLWSSYMFVSTVHHVIAYFERTTKDEEIRKVISAGNIAASEHVNEFANFLRKENLPVPRGITSEDVNLDAPALFSDRYHINYMRSMVRIALNSFSLAYNECTRNDLKQMIKTHMLRVMDLEMMAIETMKFKGMYINKPFIKTPKEIEFVEDKEFFAGFFGEKRPLTVLEINQLFLNLHANAQGKAFMMGLAQVARSEEIKDYLLTGRDLADKFYTDFSNKLKDENINEAISFESDVQSSRLEDSPFSDRLILNHAVFLNSLAIVDYAQGIGQSLRNDLSAMYTKMMAEAGMYSHRGAELLVQRRWLEQPPIKI